VRLLPRFARINSKSDVWPGGRELRIALHPSRQQEREKDLEQHQHDEHAPEHPDHDPHIGAAPYALAQRGGTRRAQSLGAARPPLPLGVGSYVPRG
jgi:hypothetical protein